MCVCVCVCISSLLLSSENICGAFNKFPDFKIVIDSWNFRMLLLYISWDDWPILMISGSNEELQQQLEYTLLKPDCPSRWISKMQCDTLEERYTIKFCFKIGRNATEKYGMLQTAFGASCMSRSSVFEWNKRFKEGRESVRDDARCGRSKQDNTSELIGQRVRVTMLGFLGSSGRDSLGRGQLSSNRLSGISTRTMHQSTTPSLSQTIWPRWASIQFLTLPTVQTFLPVSFGYSLSSEAVVMRQLRRTSMGPSRVGWNGTTSALQPEEITSKGTRVSCVYYQ